MSEALELLPADYWRWYLMANAPESDDTDFTWTLFGAAVNKDLVGTFGNFVNRTVTQVVRHFGEQVPEGGEPGDVEAALAAAVDDRLAEYRAHMDALEFRKAASALRALWAEGNAYLEQREPWRTIKVDRDRTACTLRTALQLALVDAVASAPFIPFASERLQACLVGAREWVDRLDGGLPAAAAAALPAGSPFTPPGLLFEKLDDDRLSAWADRFGGDGDPDADRPSQSDPPSEEVEA
jgi:methionyl-tRNA synthetase